MRNQFRYNKRAVCMILTVLFSFSLFGCRAFHKGKYNSSHFKMTFPHKWKEGEWAVPTVLPASSLYDPEMFTAESPARHQKTGTPEASITLFAQKMDSVVWMEDLWPMIVREYHRSGYEILQKGEIKIGGDNIFKWILCRNDERDEVSMDFYSVDDASIFYKVQYSSHINTFGKYRNDFENAKATLAIKLSFM